jgi:hypothetical protein
MSEEGYSDICFVPSTHALLIGISKYRKISGKEQFRDLNFAANDAKDFYDFLIKRGVLQENLRCLTDEGATLSAIHDAFFELRDLCTKPEVKETNPLVIIFFPVMPQWTIGIGII